MFIPSNLNSIHNIVLRILRVLVRRGIRRKQVTCYHFCELICISSELVEFISRYILYSHVNRVAHLLCRRRLIDRTMLNLYISCHTSHLSS